MIKNVHDYLVAGSFRERGLPAGPAPRDHPLWPAFKRWADEKLGENVMLGLYWECWLACARSLGSPPVPDGTDTA